MGNRNPGDLGICGHRLEQMTREAVKIRRKTRGRPQTVSSDVDTGVDR